MKEIIVLCNVPHNITEGSCALCERDRALEDARRYRTLRAMVGVLNVEIGRITGIPEHAFTKATPEDIRISLDTALDRKFYTENKPRELGEDE